MNERIICPCCKKPMSTDLYKFGEHYKECLAQHDEQLKRQDKVNEARIKLNAAVQEYNDFMKSMGRENESASVVYNTTTTGDYWNDMFKFITT